MHKAIQYLLLFSFTLGYSKTPAQEYIEFSRQWNRSFYPLSLVDSINFPQKYVFNLYPKGQTIPMVILADSLLFNTELTDTLVLDFHNGYVEVSNPHLEYIEVTTEAANVCVCSYGEQPFVCLAKGSCDDGRLIVDADTTFTLLLSDLQLTSKTGSAICLKQKQNTEIVLAEGTTNVLNDAQEYNLPDSTDTSNACFYTKGSLTFTGKGTLSVSGNYRHAIASSKNITIEEGNVNILSTQKDGIHCDKYKQEGGCVKLHLSKDATKGIKVKETFDMKGGRIEGDATGDLTITDGETSYCTLVKSDGFFQMDGGEIQLKHTGKGGRCISVDENLSITGGVLNMECHGDGDSYINVANETDYYTPKCVTVDNYMLITGGNIHCLSTGLGGKGLVAGNYLDIGSEEAEEGPFIRVETRGECIINNEDEDLRFGCPKGIKANDELHIYGGDIAISTTGMGGEGVECNGALYIHGGTLECNTFDDGINVGQSVEISGGQVYCNSVDNDGIDSNGSITIYGGIVASINQRLPNESFDSEKGQLYIWGGTVFGIGSWPVYVYETGYSYYNSKTNNPDGTIAYGFFLQQEKYIYIIENNKVLMALKNENRERNAYLTLADPKLMKGIMYYIAEGNCPTDANQVMFGGKLVVGGSPVNSYLIADIQL